MTGRNARPVTPKMMAVVDEYLADAAVRRVRTKTAQAAEIGMNLKTYGRLLNGEHAIDMRELDRIAQAMGVSSSSLLERATARIESR